MVVPQRMCIGCRQVKAKKDLIRIVRSPIEGTIAIDPQGRKKGRGAYVCANVGCVDRAMQAEKLNKAFRITHSSADRVSLEIVDRLRQDLLVLIESYYY